jgi:hypothetical protein
LRVAGRVRREKRSATPVCTTTCASPVTGHSSGQANTKSAPARPGRVEFIKKYFDAVRTLNAHGISVVMLVYAAGIKARRA